MNRNWSATLASTPPQVAVGDLFRCLPSLVGRRSLASRIPRPSCGTPPCRGGCRCWPAVAGVRTSFNHPDAESSTPLWGRERFDLQERVQALFRMESLRGSISYARSPSRDNLIGLVDCQTFKHARAVTHPLTGGISS